MNGQMMELLVFFYGIGNVSVQNTRLKVLFFPFPLFYHPMFYSYQSFSALPLMAAEEEIPLNEVVISGKEQIYRSQMITDHYRGCKCRFKLKQTDSDAWSVGSRSSFGGSGNLQFFTLSF